MRAKCYEKKFDKKGREEDLKGNKLRKKTVHKFSSATGLNNVFIIVFLSPSHLHLEVFFCT